MSTDPYSSYVDAIDSPYANALEVTVPRSRRATWTFRSSPLAFAFRVAAA